MTALGIQDVLVIMTPRFSQTVPSGHILEFCHLCVHIAGLSVEERVEVTLISD